MIFTTVNSLNSLSKVNLNSKKEIQNEVKKENFFENANIISLNNKEVNQKNINEMANLVTSLNNKGAKNSENSLIDILIKLIKPIIGLLDNEKDVQQ